MLWAIYLVALDRSREIINCDIFAHLTPENHLRIVLTPDTIVLGKHLLDRSLLHNIWNRFLVGHLHLLWLVKYVERLSRNALLVLNSLVLSRWITVQRKHSLNFIISTVFLLSFGARLQIIFNDLSNFIFASLTARDIFVWVVIKTMRPLDNLQRLSRIIYWFLEIALVNQIKNLTGFVPIARLRAVRLLKICRWLFVCFVQSSLDEVGVGWLALITVIVSLQSRITSLF